MNRVEKLFLILEQGSPRQKIEASFDLAKDGHFEGIPILIKYLESNDWEEKSRSAYYLGRIGWFPIFEKLGAIILNEKMYDVINSAVFAIQSIGFLEGVPFLLEGLKNQNFEVREDCRVALYWLLGNSVLALLNPDEEEFIEDDSEREEIYNQNASDIEAWWNEKKSMLEFRKSYFFGEKISPRLIFNKYQEAPFVNDAYLILLEDLTGMSFGKPSKKIIPPWEEYISRNSDKYEKGVKYFYGRKLEF